MSGSCARGVERWALEGLRLSPGLWYTLPMKKKPLSQTNPYLKDPKFAREMLCQAAVASFAIEGMHLSFDPDTFKPIPKSRRGSRPNGAASSRRSLP